MPTALPDDTHDPELQRESSGAAILRAVHVSALGNGEGPYTVLYCNRIKPIGESDRPPGASATRAHTRSEHS